MDSKSPIFTGGSWFSMDFESCLGGLINFKKSKWVMFFHENKKKRATAYTFCFDQFFGSFKKCSVIWFRIFFKLKFKKNSKYYLTEHWLRDPKTWSKQRSLYVYYTFFYVFAQQRSRHVFSKLVTKYLPCVFQKFPKRLEKLATIF